MFDPTPDFFVPQPRPIDAAALDRAVRLAVPGFLRRLLGVGDLSGYEDWIEQI